MKWSKKTWKWHVIVWVLFEIFFTVLNYKMYLSAYGGSFNGVLMNMLLIHLGPLVIFYTNYSYLIPALLQKRKIFLYILSLILLGAICSVYDYEARYFLERIHLRSAHVSYNLSLSVTLIFEAFFVGIGFVLRFVVGWFNMERQNSVLKVEKLNAEMNLLKSQLNPHFIFNTLNNIAYLAQEKSDLASTAVIKLADNMRYMLYESAGDQVPLYKEINYIQDVISLQKLRLSYPIPVNFSYTGNTEILIPPLLLITFVENAFKHGDTYSARGFINIELNTDEHLIYKVTNRFETIEKDNVGGIGIENLRKRLSIQYPGQHEIKTYSENDTFISYLKIKL